MQWHGNPPDPSLARSWLWVQGLLGTVVLLKESHEALVYIAHLLIGLIGS